MAVGYKIGLTGAVERLPDHVSILWRQGFWIFNLTAYQWIMLGGTIMFVTMLDENARA
ncbi:MAG: hypothetical protein AAB579_00375 [Patescibacteria group bacterium]